MRHKLLFTGIGVVCALLVVIVSGWLWVLSATTPLNVPIATWLPWPIVCTTRGCITTWGWQQQKTATEVFAAVAKKEKPNELQSLTTLVRQHLAHYGQLDSPITDAEALRYREEILNAKDETRIREATGMSLAEYDQLVITPFLEQESLRQQRRAESADDLYIQLAQERWVTALPWHLTWDKQEAKVVQN